MQIGGFLLPIRWQSSDYKADLANIAGWAESANEAGFRRALTWIEPASDELPFHQNFEQCRQRLGELAKALDPYSIRLGIGYSAAPEARQGKAFEFIHHARRINAAHEHRPGAHMWA